MPIFRFLGKNLLKKTFWAEKCGWTFFFGWQPWWRHKLIIFEDPTCGWGGRKWIKMERNLRARIRKIHLPQMRSAATQVPAAPVRNQWIALTLQHSSWMSIGQRRHIGNLSNNKSWTGSGQRQYIDCTSSSVVWDQDDKITCFCSHPSFLYPTQPGGGTAIRCQGGNPLKTLRWMIFSMFEMQLNFSSICYDPSFLRSQNGAGRSFAECTLFEGEAALICPFLNQRPIQFRFHL